MVLAVDFVFCMEKPRLPVGVPLGPDKLSVVADPEINSSGSVVVEQSEVSTVVIRDAVAVTRELSVAVTVNETLSGAESHATDTVVVSVSPGASVACAFDSDAAEL
jgi:hypothetical protein